MPPFAGIVAPLALACAAVLRFRKGERGWAGVPVAMLVALPLVWTVALMLLKFAHHRALAGATFAALSLGVLVLAALVGARVRQRLEERPNLERGLWMLAGMVSVALAIVVA